VALCFGNPVSPRKQDGLTLSNEVEFSIPPFCYLYVSGLYRIWAKVRTEKQADGRFSFYLQRVALVRQPLQVRGDLSLAGDWFVFTPFDFEDEVPGADDLRRVPDVLRIGEKEAPAKTINVANGVVDFACFWGKTYEQRVGYVYIPFTGDKAGEQTFGFGADWWYQAWLDGNPFNDTLATGNAFPGYSCTNHLATKHLAAGKHLLVVRFISGKNSSILCVGGPAEVRVQDSCLEK